MKNFFNITRLAPSPTGQLHLGNIWSFMLCWLAARASGGAVYLRIDDIDPGRSRAQFAYDQMRILEKLGFDWDGEVVWQSRRMGLYEDALEKLRQKAQVYPCFCSRHDLRSLASAPHVGDVGITYPGTCLRLSARECQAAIAAGKGFSLRLHCMRQMVEFEDLVQGRQRYCKNDYGGDFPLRRSDGVWAYQLASVVDDIDLGVNLIVRGRDLLPSTPRQIILYDLLQKAAPRFAHIPLLLDEHGERLAKRHQALAIAQLLQTMEPGRIIARLANLAGLVKDCEKCTLAELLPVFSFSRLPVADLACKFD